MIRGGKFPLLPCVLVHNARGCACRIRETSRDGGGQFPSSSFLILNFLPVYFQVPVPLSFRFLSSQSHCCLRFLLPSAPQTPSLSVFSSTPFLSSKALYLVSLTRSGKEPMELIGRRKKSRGTLQPSFASFCHQR